MLGGRSTQAGFNDTGKGSSYFTNTSNQRDRGAQNAFLPSSAERLNARECASYIAQLRGVLDAATAEPPAGVDTAEVERRMALVQAALQQVEQRSEELRREREEHQNARFIETHQRRMDAEDSAEKERSTSDNQRRVLVRDMRNLQVAYYRDRNDKIDEKAVRCREYNAQTEIDTIAKAGSNEGRRQKNLENLMAEREKATRELRKKGAARQDYARSVNKRRAGELEKERAEKEERARLHEQEVQAKLEAMRESRRSKWVAKHSAACARSKVVLENGKAVLETRALNHNNLVKELNDKVRGQQQRYATEQAERQYAQQMRTQYRAMQQERQQKNLIRILDGRVARGDEIVKAAHEKKEKGEATKEKQSTQFREAGVALRKDVAEHQRRAEAQETERENEALRKNYRRWNTRAARIIEELREAMEMEAQEEQRHLNAAANRRYADETDSDRQNSARGTAVRLPSPSDFAT